eukprot:5320319-Prymnesium_polylepis.1
MGEVCVLCPDRLGAAQCKVSVRARGGGLQHLPIEHRLFDALYHVLLFPDGYVGWEMDMPRSRPLLGASTRASTALNPRSTVSMGEYYAHRLHWRRGLIRSENCMFMTGRLFQEYAAVAFWRVEACRLNWHRCNQKEMRAERLDELRNFVSAQ